VWKKRVAKHEDTASTFAIAVSAIEEDVYLCHQQNGLTRIVY